MNFISKLIGIISICEGLRIVDSHEFIIGESTILFVIGSILVITSYV